MMIYVLLWLGGAKGPKFGSVSFFFAAFVSHSIGLTRTSHGAHNPPWAGAKRENLNFSLIIWVCYLDRLQHILKCPVHMNHLRVTKTRGPSNCDKCLPFQSFSHPRNSQKAEIRHSWKIRG